MVVKKFESIVNKYKDKVAVKEFEKSLTYRELNRIADCTARAVLCKCQAAASEPGQYRTALLFEKGIDAIVAILAVLKARGIYISFDCTYPQKRLEYMMENSGAHTILTNTKHMELAEKLAAVTGQKTAKDITIINLDTIDEEKNSRQNLNINKEIPAEPVAYILYTSGSTGKPKGVVQTCRNVFFFTKNYIKALSITPGDRLTFISSISHDGAVQDIYAALLSGATLYPIDPKKKLPLEITRKLNEENITVYHSVPTILRHILGSLGGHSDREQYSSLRLIVTGGETLYEEDVRKVCQFFPGAQLAHMYGQTESSVNTMGFIDTREQNPAITLGEPLEGIELFLLNEEGEEVEEFETGEIFIASEYLAPGYWKAPETTAQAFIHDENLGKLYRSGDLGEIDYDGGIRFIGRKDRQLKIRGFRIEPEEIENRLLKHENIKKAVVISKTDERGETFLCAYIVPAGEKQTAFGKTQNSKDLKKYLSQTLPDYMIPSYFVYMERMPLTQSGKVNWRALPKPGVERAARYAAPRNSIEEKLLDIWSRVLDMEKNEISIDDDFFALGGHSLKAIALAADIHKAFHVKIPLEQIFQHAFIKDIANYIKSAVEVPYTQIEPAEKKEYYPLSSAQKRLYIMQQVTLTSTTYNMPHEIIARDDIHKEKLISALKQLIARHESLRASFEMIEGEPVQRVHDEVEFEIEYYQVEVKVEEKEGTRGLAPLPLEPAAHSSQQAEALIRSFIRPFDLSKAPLLRVGLGKIGEGMHLLMIDMHHIISDGVSLMILVRELTALLAGKKLPFIKIQYKEFARWQQRKKQGTAMKSQEEYWLKTFADKIPVLQMPYDFPETAGQTYEGNTVRSRVDKEKTTALKSLANEEGVTLFMLLLAVYNVLLYKISGQEDIVVGTPVAGRLHTELQDVIGMFVNILVLRNRLTGEERFNRFLEQVKTRALDAYENQGYQYEDLVECVTDNTEPGRNPLFDIVFMMQNMDMPSVEIPGLKLENRPVQKQTSKFDMIMNCQEIENEINISVEYKTKLFKEETIKKFIDYFIEIISIVIEDREIKPGDIEITHGLVAVTPQKQTIRFGF